MRERLLRVIVDEQAGGYEVCRDLIGPVRREAAQVPSDVLVECRRAGTFRQFRSADALRSGVLPRLCLSCSRLLWTRRPACSGSIRCIAVSARAIGTTRATGPLRTLRTAGATGATCARSAGLLPDPRTDRPARSIFR
jgi:hypothetical protein